MEAHKRFQQVKVVVRGNVFIYLFYFFIYFQKLKPGTKFLQQAQVQTSTLLKKLISPSYNA